MEGECRPSVPDPAFLDSGGSDVLALKTDLSSLAERAPTGAMPRQGTKFRS